jgi:hypothetical protein
VVRITPETWRVLFRALLPLISATTQSLPSKYLLKAIPFFGHAQCLAAPLLLRTAARRSLSGAHRRKLVAPFASLRCATKKASVSAPCTLAKCSSRGRAGYTFGAHSPHLPQAFRALGCRRKRSDPRRRPRNDRWRIIGKFGLDPGPDVCETMWVESSGRFFVQKRC